jgi:hypothetical protein
MSNHGNQFTVREIIMELSAISLIAETITMDEQGRMMYLVSQGEVLVESR